MKTDAILPLWVCIKIWFDHNELPTFGNQMPAPTSASIRFRPLIGMTEHCRLPMCEAACSRLGAGWTWSRPVLLPDVLANDTIAAFAGGLQLGQWLSRAAREAGGIIRQGIRFGSPVTG